MTMTMKRTVDFETLTLAAGQHHASDGAMCVMEAVAYVAGEPWSDHPACTAPALAEFCRCVNDAMPDAARQLLVPLIPRLVGTAVAGADIWWMWNLTDLAVRTWAPAALRAAGLDDQAQALAELAPVDSPPAARVAADAARAVADAAWTADAAAWAAHGAARDAAAAARGAARDVADAAADAARGAEAAAWTADAAAWAARAVLAAAARAAEVDVADAARAAARAAEAADWTADAAAWAARAAETARAAARAARDVDAADAWEHVVTALAALLDVCPRAGQEVAPS